MTKGLRASSLALIFTALAAGCAGTRPTMTTDSVPACRCRPGEPCWPTRDEWQRFGASLHGKLEQPESILAPCRTDAAGEACAAAMRRAQNPFFVQDQSGGTQSTGWLGAWNAAPSAYAVAAVDAGDVAAAVDFARRHRLRLVVKGTGHDYLGRSSAPDSLLVFTHAMRRVTLHDAFVPAGAPAAERGVPAVSVEAGTRWLEAYREVAVKGGRYVQGGGCTSVGAAGGFLQGGGFGSFSKKFGIAAASLLEAEIVTADGKIRIANAVQNPDLFWALRGGGGGTFGVVTRVTLRTHPLPAFFGGVSGKVVAKSDAAFQRLLERFLNFYREALSNEHWGEQVRVKSSNTLELSMLFQGLREAEAERIWKPFRDFVEAEPDAFTPALSFFEVPGSKLWETAFLQANAPSAIQRDERADAAPDMYWWAGDAEQVGAYWYAYQSRWVPLDLFEPDKAPSFARTLFEASRNWTVAFHFNKGQAGASEEALKRGHETAMNPAVFRAAALVIVAAHGSSVPGLKGHEPDARDGEEAKEGVAEAMKLVRDAAPDSGSYVNETDYFEPDWQRSFWGENYPKLLEIKRKYDPEGLFICHHCVGSEAWQEGGMCRAGAAGK